MQKCKTVSHSNHLDILYWAEESTHYLPTFLLLSWIIFSWASSYCNSVHQSLGTSAVHEVVNSGPCLMPCSPFFAGDLAVKLTRLCCSYWATDQKDLELVMISVDILRSLCYSLNTSRVQERLGPMTIVCCINRDFEHHVIASTRFMWLLDIKLPFCAWPTQLVSHLLFMRMFMLYWVLPDALLDASPN